MKRLIAIAIAGAALVTAAPAGAHSSYTYNGDCDTPYINGCDDYLTRDEGIFNGVVGWNSMHQGCNCSLEWQVVSRINDTAIKMNIKPKGANYIWHRCIVDLDQAYGYRGVNVTCEFGRY